MAPRARTQEDLILINQVEHELEVKSKLPPEEADEMDFTQFNNENLLLMVEKITYKQYDTLVKLRLSDKKFKFKLLMQGGRVFCVEDLDIDRGFVVRKLVDLFHTGDPRDVDVVTECTIHFPSRNARAPDVALMPKDRNVLGPTVVFELGISQTLPELLSYSNDYFLGAEKSEIQLYVAFKVYQSTKQMVAIAFARDGPPRAVSFGLQPLDPSTVHVLELAEATITGVGFGGKECKKGGSEYQIPLPAAKVFHGTTVDIPQDLVRRRRSIDLYEMQRWLLLIEESYLKFCL